MWLGALLVLQATLPMLGFVGLVLVLGVFLGAMVDVARLSPPETGVPRAGKVVLGLVVLWTLTSVVANATRTWLAEPFTARSGSMESTLLPGDQFYVDKRVGNPWRRPVERGEVILYLNPVHADAPMVPRVVALEGEAVAVRCGRPSIDGREVARRPLAGCEGREDGGPACEWDEELLGDHPHGVLRQAPDCRSALDFPPSSGCPKGMEMRGAGCVVPARHVFVLGDNRENAFDSRAWGALPRENVLGSASFIHFSWTPETGVRWARIGTGVR